MKLHRIASLLLLLFFAPLVSFGQSFKLSSGLAVDGSGNLLINLAASGGSSVSTTSNGLKLDASGYVLVDIATGSAGGCIATVATLSSSCGTVAGTIASVTDGNSATDCTVGGGSHKNACIYSGSAWAPAGAGGGPPTGAAGGSLAGTYPNPSFAANPSFSGQVSVSGAGAGNINLGQGTNLQPQANAVQIEAGTSEPAAGYNVIFPATGAAGVLQSTYGTGAAGTVACSSCGALTTGNVSVSAGGTYALAPACWVTGGGGTGAACSSGALSGGAVVTANVTITNGGSGYTSAATLNFSNNVELSISTALPNGTTATTQTAGDNTTDIATDAFVLANAGGTPSFPVTVAGTVTSGGIPYFNSTTQESSSAILNTNILVKGGGAGGAPTNSSITDNGTTITSGDTGGLTLNGNGAPFTSTQGTITTSHPFITHTATWNNAGTNFVDDLRNITSTAAGGSSTFLRMQVGGVNLFDFSTNGGADAPFLTIGSAGATNTGLLTLYSGNTGGPALNFNSGTGKIWGVYARGSSATNCPANSLLFYDQTDTVNALCILTSGTIQPLLYGSQTNCSANGTAANPSVAACSAAPTGAFSCDPASSTGTCQVNDTAVTANSNILVDQASYLGSRLSVTCNTTNLGQPFVSSISPGASFTLTMGSFISNPACFTYMIFN